MIESRQAGAIFTPLPAMETQADDVSANTKMQHHRRPGPVGDGDLLQWHGSVRELHEQRRTDQGDLAGGGYVGVEPFAKTKKVLAFLALPNGLCSNRSLIIPSNRDFRPPLDLLRLVV